MKKLFSLLIISISFAYSSIDEYKTDVYFGNGILTSRESAKDNAEKLLEPVIRKDIYSNDEDLMYKDIGEVGYAYNDTFGFWQDIPESGLENITALNKLQSIGTNLSLAYNKLTNVDGLTTLSHVGHNIWLHKNWLLNVDGLIGIEGVDYQIQLQDNNLSNIDGLQNLESVGEELYLQRNKLTDLDALHNLQFVGNTLSIKQNPNLTNIWGISNIEGEEGQILEIDVGQYTTKAEEGSEFCAVVWDIHDADLNNIADNMSIVCDP